MRRTNPRSILTLFVLAVGMSTMATAQIDIVDQVGFPLSGYFNGNERYVDLDGDGTREIVANDAWIHLQTYNSDGTLHWEFETGVSIRLRACVGNLDDDGLPEIVIIDTYGLLYAVDDDGTLMPG